MPLYKSNRQQSPGEPTEKVNQDQPSVQFLSNASITKGSDSNHLLDPFDDPVARDSAARGHTEYRDQASVAVRTEEEQQAAAKEREQQEIAARKDARRKSLGK